jgi:hypothetical protein
MLNRTVVASLLAATMFLCPYGCLGRLVGQASAACGDECCCCGECPTPVGGDKPDQREDQRSDCLCHGAITDGAKVDGHLDAESGLLAVTIDVTHQAGAISPSEELSVSCEHARHFPPLVSGRQICALCGFWRL